MILRLFQLPLVVTGVTFAFTFYMLCISVVRFECFKIFLASFFITILSAKIAVSFCCHHMCNAWEWGGGVSIVTGLKIG